MNYSRQTATTFLISLGWNPLSSEADCFSRLDYPASIRLHFPIDEHNKGFVEIIPDLDAVEISQKIFEFSEEGVHNAVLQLEEIKIGT